MFVCYRSFERHAPLLLNQHHQRQQPPSDRLVVVPIRRRHPRNNLAGKKSGHEDINPAGHSVRGEGVADCSACRI